MNTESLEEAIMQMATLMDSTEERLALKPTYLIVPPSICRFLFWLPAVAKRRNTRGRKRALMKRGKSKWEKIA